MAKFQIKDTVITSKGNIGVITKIEISIKNDKIHTVYHVNLGDREFPIAEINLTIYQEKQEATKQKPSLWRRITNF